MRHGEDQSEGKKVFFTKEIAKEKQLNKFLKA